jgi:hypothetical protein
MSQYTIGLDLGQSQDYTALAILERIDPRPPEPITRGGFPAGLAPRTVPVRYECNHLQRFPLGTRYPEIVREVAEMLKTPELRDKTDLVIDATGVGRPVCDMFRQAGIAYRGVTITGGDSVAIVDGLTRVPKRILVSTLQVLLQSGRLAFAPHPLREVLVTEMLAFQVTISEAANDTYGGRIGTHDDLVLAAALAAWKAEQHREQLPRPESHTTAPDWKNLV